MEKYGKHCGLYSIFYNCNCVFPYKNYSFLPLIPKSNENIHMCSSETANCDQATFPSSVFLTTESMKMSINSFDSFFESKSRISWKRNTFYAIQLLYFCIFVRFICLLKVSFYVLSFNYLSLTKNIVLLWI